MLRSEVLILVPHHQSRTDLVTEMSDCKQVRIARIFNTYGPRMCIDDGRVVSNFVAQVGKY